jgi:hypothetical protein
MTLEKETNMITTKTSRTLTVRSGIKAGGMALTNHTRALAVRTGVKAGGFALNHNRTLMIAV